MNRQAVADDGAVVVVYNSVAVDVAILRHTWLGVGLASKVRYVCLECVVVARLVEVFVLISAIVDISVHTSHRLALSCYVARLLVEVLVELYCRHQG